MKMQLKARGGTTTHYIDVLPNNILHPICTIKLTEEGKEYEFAIKVGEKANGTPYMELGDTTSDHYRHVDGHPRTPIGQEMLERLEAFADKLDQGLPLEECGTVHTICPMPDGTFRRSVGVVNPEDFQDEG